MKVKELVKLLEDIDPSGELTVAVGNAQITYIDRLPAYYDGKLQKIVFDEGHNPRIGIYCSGGEKVVINYTTIQDALHINPFMTIISDNGKPPHNETWIGTTVKESLELMNELAEKHGGK